MSGIIPGLAGAGGAANNAGQYYTNAANQFTGAAAPELRAYTAMENADLRPQFQSAINQAGAQAAAQGITGSGSNRANLGNVTAQDSATLAGAVSPLYSQALGTAGNIYSQMPGAQEGAYNDAIQNFYQALNSGVSTAGMLFGLPGAGGGSGGGGNSYGPSTGYYEPGDSGGVSNTPYIP